MWLGYMVIFIIFGEYIVYGCLILLLDFNANKAKTSSLDNKNQLIDERPLIGEGKVYSPFSMENSANEESNSDNV